MTQRWKKRPEGSNWGEFGDDDQRGRMNLLTAERLLRALACRDDVERCTSQDEEVVGVPDELHIGGAQAAVELVEIEVCEQG